MKGSRQESSGLLKWMDHRYPVANTLKAHMSEYYVPKNLNFWYCFGVLSALIFVLLILTGIWLTMSYTPSVDEAFDSIQYIMRDVDSGWFIRYMHEIGATAFFAVIYLHMYRGILYGSYKSPRDFLWIIGVMIYLLVIAEGFIGYVLPWGNMSYWAAKVILGSLSAIPVVGEDLQIWVQGDYQLSGATLSRFYALHVVLIPLILGVLAYVHFIALHHVGSNNPDGIEIKDRTDARGIPLDGVPLHPYYTVRDLVPIVVFFIIFFAAVFYFPAGGGHFLEPPNLVPANNLSTPDHIAPVWYLTPFYAILRSVTVDFLGISAKLGGVIVMFAAMVIVVFLPWLDRSPVKSIRYKGIASKIMVVLLALSFIALGVLGSHPVDWAPFWVAPLFTITYFAYFVAMPIYTSLEKTKPVPERLPSRRQ